MNHELPFPVAVKYLISSNNDLLKTQQRILTEQVLEAAYESMKLLGLQQSEGWTVDLEKMAYVKAAENAPPVGE